SADYRPRHSSLFKRDLLRGCFSSRSYLNHPPTAVGGIFESIVFLSSQQDQSRLDQAEVTVLPLVEHAHAACLGVAKDQEVIGSRGKIQRGFFGGHGLHRVKPRVD